MKPRIFVASSVESLELAYAVQENLEHDSEVTVWSQGVFQLSRTTLASLFDALDELDFGLFVLSADDVVTIRSETVSTVRDNVIFELGLFAGRLGIERCFLIVPKGQEEVHLPTDLAGITPATFAADRQDGNMSAALGPACNRVRKAMQKYGRALYDETIVADVTQKAAEWESLCDDQNDCMNLIISWLGGRSPSENMSAIRYDEVDRALKLVSGSARKYLQAAGVQWNYTVKYAGKDTILFIERSDRV